MSGDGQLISTPGDPPIDRADPVGGGGTPRGGSPGGRGNGNGTGGGPAAPPLPIRFYGSIDLDMFRLGRDAGQIAQEVVQLLSSLAVARVTVTLEIQADVPAGFPDPVVRTVAENCRTLRFGSHGFEES